MKKSLINSIISLALVFALFILTLSIVFSWFIQSYKFDKPFLGQTTSSYFAGGTGIDEANAYIITKPEHFFNLAYLQNLGYFTTKTYFKIPVGNPVIDFTNYSYHQTIPPIGTATNPFLGVFNGNKTVLKGYTINGTDMQDVGTFGYVGDGAVISNLFLETPTIISEQTVNLNTTGFHEHNDLTAILRQDILQVTLQPE
jgi:hypothetical protein